MALTAQQFSTLEGNIREVWDAFHKAQKDYNPELYNIVKGNMAQYTDYTIGTAGRMTPWTGAVAYDTISEGYTKQYRASKHSTGIQVDRDMYEDKEWNRIKNHVNLIAYGVHKTLQYDGADIFNQAFTTAYLGPDGKRLCATDHKSTPDAPAQSNTGTLELNYDNLETTLRAMEDWVDDRGDKMLIEGNRIIAGSAQRVNCQKLFGSDKEAYVADNTKNVYNGFDFFIHPLISGNKWFVVNKELMKGGAGLNMFMRRDPRSIERDGDAAKGDFNTEMLSWKCVGRWTKGWTNYFWCYGQNPA